MNACKLLTATDAEAIVGAPTRPGQQASVACNYSGPKGEVIGIEVTSVPLFNAIRSATKASGGTTEPLEGVGDEAYFVPAKDGGKVRLYVRKGNRAFQVVEVPTAASQPYAARKTAAQKVAVQALGRL